jgi:hypothetical protein
LVGRHTLQVAFRPEVQGWGDKGTLYVSNIIDMIPPEAEADLAIYPVLDVEGSRGINDALADVHPQVEQSSAITKSEDIRRYLTDANAAIGRPVEADHGVKLELDAESSANLNSVAEREDVYEGFFEEDWDDDID